MVTYCLGSARQKREYFKEASGVVVLDNVEVLFCASENGRNYFAYGDVPFKAFTAEEYLTYARALESEKVTPVVIRSYGISPRKRLGRLTPAEMRTVTFLELTAGKPDRAVVINLDGAKCSRRGRAALKRLLDHIPDAYVCITDKRFLPRSAEGVKTLYFGKTLKTPRPSFYAAKKLAKKIGAKRVAVM